MNRQLLAIIIYLGIMLPLIFSDVPYAKLIVVAITFLFLGYLFVQFNNLARNNFEGDLVLRRQTKRIRPIFILIAIFPTITYFINDRASLLQLFLSWSAVLFDVILTIQTTKLKPIGMVIKGKELLLNDFRNTKRDLGQLTSITLNGWTNVIELTFVNEKQLLINRNEYLPSDIESFIELCKERSEQELLISDYLRKAV